MDETRLIETMRTVLKEELKAFATKDDIKAIREEMKAFATKEDFKAFATKEDLKAFATKEDLKAFATKEDFLEFEKRISSSLQNVREGVRLSLIELEQVLRDIKSKLRFYDFDFLVRQNDTLIKTLQNLYEEKTIMNGRLREYEKRLETIEATV